MSVLRIDAVTELPLLYEYVSAEGAFRTVGFVRVRGAMVPEITHWGPDTLAERDRFLLKVLTVVGTPPKRARQIVRRAKHVRDPDSYAASPSGSAATAPGVGDGLHLGGRGLLLGLLAGVLVGWFLGRWYGAVIGAFVGASLGPDVVMRGWQIVHAGTPRNAVTMRDAVTGLLVVAGSIAGALTGFRLGQDGFEQAFGVFAGMALAGFVLSVLVTPFSWEPFRSRLMMWLGPLVVGLCTWAAYAVWHHPVMVAVGILVGSQLAAVPATRLMEPGGVR